MKKFQLAWVRLAGGVTLGTTDVNLIKWFLNELKKYVPNYRITYENKDLDGNLWAIHIDKLDGKDSQIHIWLIREILQMGWEPFSMESGSYYFRQEIIDEELKLK